jgi:enoyl-CoA hydratase/carnithine racemase
MQEEIFSAVESVAKSDARVLVIKGDGENFCLGGDVRDWPGVPVTSLGRAQRCSPTRSPAS